EGGPEVTVHVAAHLIHQACAVALHPYQRLDLIASPPGLDVELGRRNSTTHERRKVLPCVHISGPEVATRREREGHEADDQHDDAAKPNRSIHVAHLRSWTADR